MKFIYTRVINEAIQRNPHGVECSRPAAVTNLVLTCRHHRQMKGSRWTWTLTAQAAHQESKQETKSQKMRATSFISLALGIQYNTPSLASDSFETDTRNHHYDVFLIHHPEICLRVPCSIKVMDSGHISVGCCYGKVM